LTRCVINAYKGGMNNEENAKVAVVEPVSAEPQAGTSETKECSTRSDNIAKVREATVTVLSSIAARSEAVAAKARSFVTAAQDTIPKAKEAVVAKVQSAEKAVLAAKQVITSTESRFVQAGKAVTTESPSLGQAMDQMKAAGAAARNAAGLVGEAIATKARAGWKALRG